MHQEIPLTPAILDRARGALLGQACGDALGTTVEFQTRARIARDFPNGVLDLIGGGPFDLLPGQITDDTELALALARTLARDGRFDDDAVAAAYVGWYHSRPFDIGTTTAAAFGRPAAAGPGLAASVRARASSSSQANGSLMRQSPLAVFGWRLSPDDLADLACRDSTLSHPNPTCQEACVAFTFAIALALRTGAHPAQLHAETLAFAASRPAAHASGVLGAIAAAAEGNHPDDFHAQMGWVIKALQNAFFQLLHAPSVEAGIIETVRLGGDTDTNACIAGALLGAAHGAAAFPERWIKVLLNCRTPRPEAFWCVDLPALAETLAGA